MIAPGRGAHFVGLAKAVRAGEMAGDMRIALLFEVAGAGTSNEARVARRVVPADGLAVRDDRQGRGTATATLRILFSTTVTPAMAATATSFTALTAFAALTALTALTAVSTFATVTAGFESRTAGAA